MSRNRTSPNPIYDETVQAAGFDPRDPEQNPLDPEPDPKPRPPKRKPLGGRND